MNSTDWNGTVWVVTDGGAGFEVQAVGVAEALGLTPVIKRVAPSAPWRWFAPFGPAQADGAIAPPWPDLVIAAGRKAIPYARMIRKRARGKTFVAILQDPRVPPSWFDFVWVPAHDRLRGPNVMTTVLSPHRITPQRLAAEAAKFAAQIAPLPHPRVAVLLGGANGVFTFDERAAERIGGALHDVAKRYGAGLMVTPSRRTGAAQAAIVRRCIADVPHVMWDMDGSNPYFGYLGSADFVLVTCDSVNMVGEAIATGKPVHVIALDGQSPKWDRFLGDVYAARAARPFAGVLDAEASPLGDPTQQIASALKARLLQRR
jgi:mitochondrial fission protein ELM1